MNEELKNEMQEWLFADRVLETPTGPAVNGFLPKFNIEKSDGKTKVLKENENSVAGRAQFLDEGKDPTSKDNNMSEVLLTPKRVITYVELSNQLINDSGIDFKKHLMNRAQKRIQSIIERMITYTGYTGSSGSIETSENMQLLSRGGNGFTSSKTLANNTLEYSIVKNVYQSFVSGGNNKNTAFWLFNDATTQVLDAQNNDLIKYDSENLPDGAFGTLLSIPVYKASLPIGATGRQVACVLVAPESYTVLLGKTKFKEVTDDGTQARRASTLYIVEQYVDGKVTNLYGKYAIEFADVIAQNESDPEEVENPTMKMAAESETSIYIPMTYDTPYFISLPEIGEVVFCVERAKLPKNQGKETVFVQNNTNFDITVNGVIVEAQSVGEIGKVADLKDSNFQIENTKGQAVEVELNIID